MYVFANPVTFSIGNSVKSPNIYGARAPPPYFCNQDTCTYVCIAIRFAKLTMLSHFVF